jgi:DedD protein
MNLAMNERTKHRLTGLIVILAVAIIFVPAMLKKSNQRLEENIHVSVQLPPKPNLPKVALTQEKDLFEALAVAQVTLPETSSPSIASQLASIEELQPNPIKKQATPVVIQAKKTTKKTVALTTPPYAVQLAVFNVEKNAEKLVSKLKGQGYKARYQTLTSNKGTPLYKVTVGQLDDRADAHQLKNKLIDSTQLKGFVVKREMG